MVNLDGGYCRSTSDDGTACHGGLDSGSLMVDFYGGLDASKT